MPESPEDSERILATKVFVRGDNRPFGELTIDDVRARADELRAATGWGPTARVAPVARAWRELSIEMERAGATTVGELDAGTLAALAPQLWVVLPG
jgi:hypothetical protein